MRSIQEWRVPKGLSVICVITQIQKSRPQRACYFSQNIICFSVKCANIHVIKNPIAKHMYALIDHGNLFTILFQKHFFSF